MSLTLELMGDSNKNMSGLFSFHNTVTTVHEPRGALGTRPSHVYFNLIDDGGYFNQKSRQQLIHPSLR